MKAKLNLEQLIQARRVQLILDGVYDKTVQRTSMINAWREYILPQVGCSYRVAHRYWLTDTSELECRIAVAQAKAIVGHRTRYTARLERQLRAKGEIYPEVLAILDGGTVCDDMLRGDVDGCELDEIFEAEALSGVCARPDDDCTRIYVLEGLDR